MKLDINDKRGNWIGTITDEHEGTNVFLVILGIAAFIFFVVLPIIVWYIYFFKPDYFSNVENGVEMFNSMCTTAIIAACIWGLISRILFRSGFIIIALPICSTIVVLVNIAKYNWINFGDSIILPIAASVVPCLVITAIYALLFIGQSKSRAPVVEPEEVSTRDNR